MKNNEFTLKVTATRGVCPIGEIVGQRNADGRAIPVMSCEGACIRGEIARLAANRVAKTPGYARACHGELFSVPDSAMARANSQPWKPDGIFYSEATIMLRSGSTVRKTLLPTRHNQIAFLL